MKKILVTGSSGFIGFHLTKRLLSNGYYVVGVDNMNDYYDPSLKESRLGLLRSLNKELNTSTNFEYFKEDVSNKKFISHLFENNDFDYVVHLAAQAGVRYSLTNPDVYIKSNINGFFNILEGCRHSEIKHLLFASSSSVYGLNSSMPFSTSDLTDFPVSLYAATKKSNELMAFTYSHLYNIPSTGLRMFTVYGPSGRPDMAYYKFTKSILEGDPIEVYNRGEMKRDFTYIDDIIESVYRLIRIPPAEKKAPSSSASAPYDLFNIGNNNPVSLNRFIEILETCSGIKAKKINLAMQPGDVLETYADIDNLKEKIDYEPKVSIEEGLANFVEWYKNQI